MTQPLLRTIRLAFAYGPGALALKDITVDIYAGDRIALLGSNGAGKSTLLRVLVGLQPPCSGQLRVEGEPVEPTRAGRERLRHFCGMVLQDPDDQLFAHSVEADVAFGPLNNGAGAAEAELAARTALERMGVAHLVARRVSALSLGEKKRVAIAGVLAMQPRVLLLDEPTAGLDYPGATALAAALWERSEEGAAVVVATHDTDFAVEWATRAVVLNAGRIVADGAPGRLLADALLCRRAGLRPVPRRIQGVGA